MKVKGTRSCRLFKDFVKDNYYMTSAVYCGRKAPNQTNKREICFNLLLDKILTRSTECEM